jgi:hypothetical protein
MFTIFKAKIGPITVDEKKTVLKLIFPEEFDLISVYQLMKQKGKTVKIEIFGDEQLSIDDLDVPTPHKSGLSFISGPSGIVENVTSEDDDQEDGQEEIDITDGPEETENVQESVEPETENDIADHQEVDFESEFNGQTQEAETENGEEGAASVVEVEGKDALETYILNGKAPKYDDIPYDFPELLKRKQAGETWMEIATTLKVSSNTLSAAWSKYRKNVKAYMEGEEHGAA